MFLGSNRGGCLWGLPETQIVIVPRIGMVKNVPLIFLLSPAHAGGQRARMLARPQAQFPLAQRLRNGETTLGEVFAFLSGLYFRGKVAYVEAFSRPPRGVSGGWVVTTNSGLVELHTPVNSAVLAEFGAVQIDSADPAYAQPLLESARVLRKRIGPACRVVLLGSVATGKYVDLLLPIFGENLLFPIEFVGRGDMSRGGLMLRCAASREELMYRPVAGAVRRGKRAAKLDSIQLIPTPRGLVAEAGKNRRGKR